MSEEHKFLWSFCGVEVFALGNALSALLTGLPVCLYHCQHFVREEATQETLECVACELMVRRASQQKISLTPSRTTSCEQCHKACPAWDGQ